MSQDVSVSEESPLVSIVTPTLNSADFLPDLIAAVEAQTYGNVEHVIVDGASTDGTVDLIREYASRRQVRWVSEPDSGNLEAASKAVRMATGDFLVVVPSDDLIFPWSVQTVVDHFLAHPEVEVVHGDSISWDMTSGAWSLRLHKRFTYGYLVRTQTITPQATYYRRHLLEGHEDLDQSLPHACDYDQIMKVVRGRKVVNIPEVLAIFRKRPGAVNMREGAHLRIAEEVKIASARYTRTSGPIYNLMTMWDRFYGALHRRRQIFRLVRYSRRSDDPGKTFNAGTPWRNFLSAYSVSGSSKRGLLSTLFLRRQQYSIDIWSRPTSEDLGAAERPQEISAGQRS